MLSNFKSWIAVGVVASLFVLPAFVQGPTQSGSAKVADAQDPFHRSEVLNFAVLQYSNSKGEMINIMASTMTKIWLLATSKGAMRLEILFENGDYSMIQISNMNFIHRMQGASAVNVPVVRSGMEGMAFPDLNVK